MMEELRPSNVSKLYFMNPVFGVIFCGIYLTYLPTPWSSVLLEKLTGSAASQEIPRIS